ncbi:hypothetical protein ABMA28_001665 [Loxostege sticticalis]|uniref:EGF-like domain-containing protein n=1 Tax=Loxostege sticticalis TaxID=481309 RepID=A0ABD0T2Q9_LOXSC
MAVLQSTIILCILMSCCIGLSPPKKPPGKAHTTPRCPKTEPTPRCAKNEHYVQNSTACEKTCANREFMDLAGACKPISKCVCVGDLMRLNDDATGPCVSEDQCPPGLNCGPYEVASKEKIVCPPQTCASLFGSFYCPPQDPVPGCNCIDGYLRDESGTCIPSEQCPPNPVEEPCPDGDKNATRQECPSWCQPTCEYPVPGDICPAACFPRGCVCKPGFILESRTGQCISPDDCPKDSTPVCGDNEVATKDRKICPPQTCPSLYIKFSCLKQDPEAGCDCVEGYLRNSSGICIPKEKCPPHKQVCPPQTCESLHRAYACIPGDRDPIAGCNCIDGYFRNASGVCVPADQCPPPPSTECGLNEEYSSEKIICPPQTCESIYTSYSCQQPPPPREAGCNCINGYLRNRSNICVPSEECPPPTQIPECGYNEMYTYRKISCPPETCDTLYLNYPCPPPEHNPIGEGCVCLDGHLRNDSGVCVPKEECPPEPSNCNGDRNATYQECPSACQPTCEKPELPEACIDMCAPAGCVCNPGYVRSKEGICVLPQDCPDPSICNGDRNATYQECPSACQPTCEKPELPEVCIAMCAPAGCVCNPGYVLSKEGICVLPQDCPVGPGCKGDRNSTYRECPSTCQPTCKEPVLNGPCNRMCAPSGCVCNSGYVLSEEGTCILPQDCPGPYIQIVCGPNEEETDQKRSCPPETCESRGRLYKCAAEEPTRGCKCKDGYYRNRNNECIPEDECPKSPNIQIVCGPNEEETDQKRSCPPETCESRGRLYKCAAEEPTRGCKCKVGYYRNRNNECIPEDECPKSPNIQILCGPNEEETDQKRSCPPETCESRGRLYKCAAEEPKKGCKCKDGYYRDRNNKCIPENKCPKTSAYASSYSRSERSSASSRSHSSSSSSSSSSSKNTRPKDKGCNGDRNATYTTCTSRCPRSCGSPSDIVCAAVCGPPGCQCKPGYTLSPNGKCILPEDCPATCEDKNAEYQECPSMCQPTCEQPEEKVPCPAVCAPAGCVCKLGFLLSDGKCVRPENCPEPPNCNGDRNATYQECPSMCQPTCEKPELPEACIAMCAPDGCVCKPGYVLSKEGKCVLPQDCPAPSCNGDRNATYKECPSMCQPSCEQPDPEGCIEMCAPDGCVCKQGYLLSGGKCVLPQDCPGGSPKCPANEQFVYCKGECPTSYCPMDDSRAILMCDPPYPCPSGCSCKAGFLRKSYDDKTCIESSSCPEINCTRQNEVWEPKPPQCVAERCADALNPQPCDKSYPNYTPQCVCKKDHYRNDSDICVPVKECPAQCSVPERCRPTCAVPNPPNCPTRAPGSTNVDGCECQADYILSGVGGKCIRISECPHQSCNGDPHAVIKSCPWPCPATCDSPNAAMCDKKCALGCECKSGYLLSKDGKCILPDDCPRGNPCGPNGTFVDCGFRCPNQYCPQDDSRVQYACKPGRPCPPGCACKINHKRLSYENDTCIEAADCPPVNCTSRPNEVWDPCPSDCLAEDCANAYDRPTTCNTLLLNCDPKCVCKKDHFRNGSDICVPAKECSKY